MNVLFPPITPQFLNETGFTNLGFFTGNASTYQIQIAASIAENQVARSIGTFLTPTTGVYVQFPFLGFQQYELPVGKLINVEYVIFNETYSDGSYRYISGSAIILDKELGYIKPFISTSDVSSCGCGGRVLGIETFDVYFTAGYQSGVANSPIINPQVLFAAYKAMDINLKMLYDEGIGQHYLNQVRTIQVGRYLSTFETKGFHGNTVFGPSADAQFIETLLEPYKIRRAGRLSGRTQRNSGVRR